MQATYLAGQPASVTVNFAEEGVALESILALEYEVSKASGEVLLARTEVTPAESITMGVESAHNELDPKELRTGRGLRVVRFFAQTEGGTRLITKHYVVESISILQAGLNSFQSYEEALLLSYELEALGGWYMAQQSARVNALAQAYREICTLRFKHCGGGSLNELTPEGWARLPEAFIEALRRAQVYQANDSFVQQETQERQANGVASITVGQSTTSFARVRRASSGVSMLETRARRELSAWIDASLRIVRT